MKPTIQETLDRHEWMYGADRPLPFFAQVGTIIEMLNTHFAVCIQHEWVEDRMMQNLIREHRRCHEDIVILEVAPEPSLETRKAKHEAIVAHVGEWLDPRGKCMVRGDYTHNPYVIADYINLASREWGGSVMPAHVRNAQHALRKQKVTA